MASALCKQCSERYNSTGGWKRYGGSILAILLSSERPRGLRARAEVTSELSFTETRELFFLMAEGFRTLLKRKSKCKETGVQEVPVCRRNCPQFGKLGDFRGERFHVWRRQWGAAGLLTWVPVVPELWEGKGPPMRELCLGSSCWGYSTGCHSAQQHSPLRTPASFGGACNWLRPGRWEFVEAPQVILKCSQDWEALD